MRVGMVRDAATAKTAAQVANLLRECDLILAACRPEGEEAAWDLASVRARLARVRALVCGEIVAPPQFGQLTNSGKSTGAESFAASRAAGPGGVERPMEKSGGADRV